MSGAFASNATWFQRYLLPGLAFKAVVIGGGYATGRELAEFFLPSGALGGLAAMLFATILFSLISIVTFLFARRVGAYDYQSFFRALLGRGWVLFEAAYALFVILILAVYGAAAGAIGKAVFGLPEIVGTLALMGGIAAFVMFGNAAVERLFRDVSYLLYGVYLLFVILVLSSFGDRIGAALSSEAAVGPWVEPGLTYAGYNIIGAAVILPVVRHMTSTRDAVVAGLLAGPFAMIPAFLFFICILPFQAEVGNETLPSDLLLRRLELPWFHLLFQLMIFSALLESGTGAVHAINERVDRAWRARRGEPIGKAARLAVGLLLLVGCMLVAERFGLVALIASGYRALSYILIAVFVLPLLTIGIFKLTRPRPTSQEAV